MSVDSNKCLIKEIIKNASNFCFQRQNALSKLLLMLFLTHPLQNESVYLILHELRLRANLVAYAKCCNIVIWTSRSSTQLSDTT